VDCIARFAVLQGRKIEGESEKKGPRKKKIAYPKNPNKPREKGP